MTIASLILLDDTLPKTDSINITLYVTKETNKRVHGNHFTEHPIQLYRVKHTTRARCIGTERSFPEIQNQLQSLYFVHNEFEKIVFNSVRHFLGFGFG